MFCIPCVRAPPGRQEGSTASWATDRRLPASQRDAAHHTPLEDVPARHGPSCCRGLPVHLDAAVRGYHGNRWARRHHYLSDADNCTGETRGEVKSEEQAGERYYDIIDHNFHLARNNKLLCQDKLFCLLITLKLCQYLRNQWWLKNIRNWILRNNKTKK